MQSRKSPGFDPNILFWHRRIWGAADKAVLLLNNYIKKIKKNPPV
jgi:hypothetical protein